MNDPIEVEVVEIDGKDVEPKAPPPPPPSSNAPFSWQRLAWRDLKGQIPWRTLLRRTPWWAWLFVPLGLIALSAVAALILLGMILRLLLRAIAALFR